MTPWDRFALADVIEQTRRTSTYQGVGAHPVCLADEYWTMICTALRAYPLFPQGEQKGTDAGIEAAARVCDELAATGRKGDTVAGRHAAGALDMAARKIRALKNAAPQVPLSASQGSDASKPFTDDSPAAAAP